MRKADRAVDHVRKLRRVVTSCAYSRDIREHAVEVELLLVAAAAHRRFRLAADGEDRHMVELGVVEAGDQVGGARDRRLRGRRRARP